MRLRAEFSVQAGHKKFNPVNATRGLLGAMLKAHPSIAITSVDDHIVFKEDKDIPEDITTFDKSFLVTPHLGRTGGGTVHIHFCVSHEYTIDKIKADKTMLHYLQYHKVWITPSFPRQYYYDSGLCFYEITHHDAYY